MPKEVGGATPKRGYAAKNVRGKNKRRTRRCTGTTPLNPERPTGGPNATPEEKRSNSQEEELETHTHTHTATSQTAVYRKEVACVRASECRDVRATSGNARGTGTCAYKNDAVAMQLLASCRDLLSAEQQQTSARAVYRSSRTIFRYVVRRGRGRNSWHSTSHSSWMRNQASERSWSKRTLTDPCGPNSITEPLIVHIAEGKATSTWVPYASVR